MENNKISGVKNALQSMLFYYMVALSDEYENPLDIVINDLKSMLSIADNQLKILVVDSYQNGSFLDNLDISISLLSKIEKENILDLESIKIVKEMLLITKEQARIILTDESVKNN